MSIVLLQLKALSLDVHKHSFDPILTAQLIFFTFPENFGKICQTNPAASIVAKPSPHLHGTKQGCEWGKCKIEKVFFVLPLLGGIPSVTIIVMLCYVAFLVLHRIRSFAFDMLGLRPLYRFQLRVL